MARPLGRAWPLSQKILLALSCVLLLGSLAWLHEFLTCGHCWISTNLAPFIIIGSLILNVSGMVLAIRRNNSSTRD